MNLYFDYSHHVQIRGKQNPGMIEETFCSLKINKSIFVNITKSKSTKNILKWLPSVSSYPSHNDHKSYEFLLEFFTLRMKKNKATKTYIMLAGLWYLTRKYILMLHN